MHTRRSSVSTVALLATLLLGTGGADAQLAPPTIVDEGSNGVFRIEFTTPNVFDLSSDWVAHSDKGRFSGQLRTSDGEEIYIDHKIGGSCKTSRGVTTVKQTIKSIGAVGGGDLYWSTSKYEGVMYGYGNGVKLVGQADIHSCLRYDYGPFSKKKVTVCTDTVDKQIYTHDGRWSIRLGFDNAGKNLIGYATISVAEAYPDKAKSYDTVVSGKVDPDGEANFKLKPLHDNGIGGTIKLRAIVIPRNGDTAPQLVEILEVGGNILGQKFAEVY